MCSVSEIGMELPAGGTPQAKLPAGIAAELRSLVKRKKPTRVLGFILHCIHIYGAATTADRIQDSCYTRRLFGRTAVKAATWYNIPFL